MSHERTVEDLTLTSRPPILFVLSGPSAAGKDSVIRELKARFPDLHYTITVTTRPVRAGEVPGESYNFITQDGYDRLMDAGELLAPARVHGHWYGAPLEQIRTAFERGRDVFLKIDVQGAIQVRRRFPQAVFIFLAPVSPSELAERLERRRTESPGERERRLDDASFEMEQMSTYDYRVVNQEGHLDRAVSSVACVIEAERLRLHRQPIDLNDLTAG